MLFSVESRHLGDVAVVVPGYFADERGFFSETALFDELKITTPLVPVSSSEFPSPVARRLYSVLDNAALSALGMPPLPHWRDALNAFINSTRR